MDFEVIIAAGNHWFDDVDSWLEYFQVMIRMASLSDIPQLVKLRVLMQCEVHSLSIDKATPEFLSATSKYFEDSMRDQSYLSAVEEIEGKIVSANGLILYRKPPSLDSFNGLIGYVSNVYTLPDFRGQGMALKLMQLLVSHARSMGVTKLHLGATEDGKGVYTRAGFQSVKFAAMELRL